MSRSRNRSTTALAATAAFLAMAIPGAARAEDHVPSIVSGPPYTFTPAGQSQGIDGEVSLAVDPRNGRMVAAWMQDIGPSPDVSSSIVITASSTDGGNTWTRSVPGGVMLADQPPGPEDVTADPSVSVGPDGRWYLGRLAEEAAPSGPFTGHIFVSTSTDGTTWSPAVPVAGDDGQDDYDTVVADPTTAGRAYVTYTNYMGPPPGLPGAQPAFNRLVISVTTDGGTTYSVPTTVHTPPDGYLEGLSRLAVLSDGSLLDVFTESRTEEFFTGPFTLYATRSTDGGTTWSSPVQVATIGGRGIVVDPRTQQYLTWTGSPTVAAGPNGTAQIAWATTMETTSADVWIASSSDAGATWSSPSDIHRSAQVFRANVAIAAGASAVTWYEVTEGGPGGDQLLASVLVAHSTPGGQHWPVHRLAGPFDIRAMEDVGGFPGDYEALVPAGDGFAAAFTLGGADARYGPSDIFVATVS
jgi:hypothetical protein